MSKLSENLNFQGNRFEFFSSKQVMAYQREVMCTEDLNTGEFSNITFPLSFTNQKIGLVHFLKQNCRFCGKCSLGQFGMLTVCLEGKILITSSFLNYGLYLNIFICSITTSMPPSYVEASQIFGSFEK